MSSSRVSRHAGSTVVALLSRSSYEIKTSEDVKHEVKLLGFLSDLYAITKATEEGRTRNPGASESEQLYSVCKSTIVPLELPDASSLVGCATWVRDEQVYPSASPRVPGAVGQETLGNV